MVVREAAGLFGHRRFGQLDEDFAVAPGIRSTLRDIVTDFNFGVVQVLPSGSGAEVTPILAHDGNSYAFGVDVKDLL